MSFLYAQAIKNTWNEMLIYRLSFVIWRTRSVMQLLLAYFLWSAILPVNQTFASYDRTLMLTYIFGTTLVYSVVLTTKTHVVSEEINEGTLSNYLIRPLHYFRYLLSRDVADKALNILFSIGEISVLAFLLHPPIFFQTNILYIVLTVLALVSAVMVNFVISLLMGTVGFWSRDVWGIRFIYFNIISFFAGGLFPLDILPEPVYRIIQLLPFSYLLYFPVKVYLGQLPINEVFLGLLISLGWAFLLFFFLQYVWKKGLKTYAAYGK